MEPVSARAWSELLHAEVGYLLRRADIPCLHIKGPTVAQWLYAEGERDWGDVDILVPPSRMDDALATLVAAGMTEAFPGVNRQTCADHAVTLGYSLRPGPPRGRGGRARSLRGHRSQCRSAFEELWRRREPTSSPTSTCGSRTSPTRALLIALNTARAATALRRARTCAACSWAADDEDWDSLIWLARRIEALPALRAGLELADPAGATWSTDRARRRPVTPEWRLRVARAPRTALRLDEVAHLPWSRRIPVIARWLVPVSCDHSNA